MTRAGGSEVGTAATPRASGASLRGCKTSKIDYDRAAACRPYTHSLCACLIGDRKGSRV
jgi:hypothetical protein